MLAVIGGSVIDTFAELRDKSRKDLNDLNFIIEIDGGINAENIQKIKDAGCDLIVAGSAVFKNDIDKNIKELNKIIK